MNYLSTKSFYIQKQNHPHHEVQSALEKDVLNSNNLLFIGPKRAVEVYKYVFIPFLIMWNHPRRDINGVNQYFKCWLF